MIWGIELVFDIQRQRLEAIQYQLHGGNRHSQLIDEGWIHIDFSGDRPNVCHGKATSYEGVQELAVLLNGAITISGSAVQHCVVQ